MYAIGVHQMNVYYHLRCVFSQYRRGVINTTNFLTTTTMW